MQDEPNPQKSRQDMLRNLRNKNLEKKYCVMDLEQLK